MPHGAWRQRALILQGRPVWLKVVQKPSPSRAAIALTLPAARATSTLLSARRVWKPFFLATPAAAARRALRACASHSVPWTMSALVDPNARQEGQSLLPRILTHPYVEAQGSADIARSLTRFSFLTLNRREPSFSSELMPGKGVVSLLDGDDVAEVLLEQRSEVLDLGGRVDGAARADGEEAVGLRRRLELARLCLLSPLGGVERKEVDGDAVWSWQVEHAASGVVVEEGACLLLAAEGDANGP